ncbi:MAG: ATP-binding protein [Candidatus Methylacidiphilales bacterium]
MIVKNVLALKFTAIIAAVLLIFSLFAYEFLNSFRNHEFNQNLKASSENLAYIILDTNEVDHSFIKSAFDHHSKMNPKQILMVFENNNKQYFAIKNLNKEVIQYILDNLATQKEFSFIKNDTTFVAFNYEINKAKFKIIASGVDDKGKVKMSFLKYSLVGLFIISIMLTALLGRVFAKQALMPVNKVIGQVDKISESNLFERLDRGNGKDEIAQLAITFNQMLDRLENSFKLQKTFVSNASHEFRTPLTVMKGQIEVLLLQPRASETYIKTFESLLDDINNQIELINGLGNLANANANFPNISLSKVYIIDLLDECVSELMRNKKYNAVLNFEDFPDNENTLYLKGNHALLRSALMNVMDNACKFNQSPTCQVNFKCNNEFMVITVIDSGLGISKVDISHVFESFYRSNNIRHIQGHGIGLSLVKKIIDLHHGKITIASELGKGTKISIYLPNITSENNVLF